MRCLVLISVVLTGCILRAFTLDDIHYWVGEGVNCAGVAVRWNGLSKAWGVRWNGNKSIGDVLRAVVAEDGRLQANDALTVFAYDRVWAPSVDAVFGIFAMSSSATFSAGACSPISLSANAPSGGWILASEPMQGSPAELSAAETPYGWKVVDSYTEATSSYNNPAVVLGCPTRIMTVPSVGLPFGASDETPGTYVINPAYPAWLSGRLFSLVGTGDGDLIQVEDSSSGLCRGAAFVTIEFDHDVIDDQDNPFGVDFIVFGNALCVKKGKGLLISSDDPANCQLTAQGGPEETVVEVAQHKEGPWYTSDAWRSSDAFAPTLGYRYDPDNRDENLYSGNMFWGAPTDPTYPVDPHVDFENCANITLAELCRRYNGSAGGVGYDLKDVEYLPSDDAHGGRKWFRYVRISNTESEEPNDDGDYFSMPEVDAVADVAPVSGYRQWVLANFSWAEAWQTNLTAETVIAPNGLPNGLNCVYGLSPNDTVAENVTFKVESFVPGETEHVITMRSPAKLTAAPKGLVVKETVSLGSTWSAVVPTFQSSEQQGDGTWLNTFTVPAGGGTFFKLSLDE